MCIRTQPDRQARKLLPYDVGPTTGNRIGTTTLVVSYDVPVPGSTSAPAAGAMTAVSRAATSRARRRMRKVLVASGTTSRTRTTAPYLDRYRVAPLTRSGDDRQLPTARSASTSPVAS